MKFTLLVAVVTVLVYIPANGSPLPKEQKSSSSSADENEKSSKTEETTSEKQKSKPNAENEEKNKKVVSTTPETMTEEENVFYVMVPASNNQMENLKPLQFDFKKISKMPLQSQYVVKQPRVPSIPLPYQMFTSQDYQYPMMMDPETELEFSLPNKMTKMSDDLPVYYIPPRSKQPFDKAEHVIDDQSPFVFLGKDNPWNPWSTYLESFGYYK